MRPLLFLAPLLLVGCGGSWPTGSVVQMGSDADAGVLAPVVTECLANVLPARAVVSLPADINPLAIVLADDVSREGMTVRSDGVPVSYVVAGIGQGLLVRVSAKQAGCSQYFNRTSGALKAGGPMMVFKQ